MKQLTFPFFESYLYWNNHKKLKKMDSFVWNSGFLANLSVISEIVEDELE